MHDVPDNREAPGTPAPVAANDRTSLGELALLFVRLGATSFGGPAAHIAMMEDEVVHRRRWLSRDEFLDLIGATNLIPGPNSTELAIHIGRARAGWRGLLVAGTCFIFPAMVIVLGLAWAYVRFGALPAMTSVMAAVAPVVVVIVAQALWRLSRTALKSTWLVVVAVLGVIAVALGVHELVVLAAAATAAGASRMAHRPRGAATRDRTTVAAFLATDRTLTSLIGHDSPAFSFGARSGARMTGATAVTAGTIVAGAGTWPIFLFFLKVGSVLFGSGYVLYAFLRADLVTRWSWLTETQLLDAIAVGQVTPGPVFTTATFIGYLLAGVPGALVATLGIFLPAFVFVAASAPLIPRLRRSPLAGAMLDAINAASLALMAVVTWHIARTAVTDALSIVLAITSAVLLLRFRIGTTWLLLAAAAVGLASPYLGRLFAGT